MVRKIRENVFTAVLQEVLVLGPLVADGDQESTIGVSDTEIRIGNILYRSAGRVRDADAERVLDLIQSRSAAIMCVTLGAPSR